MLTWDDLGLKSYVCTSLQGNGGDTLVRPRFMGMRRSSRVWICGVCSYVMHDFYLHNTCLYSDSLGGSINWQLNDDGWVAVLSMY